MASTPLPDSEYVSIREAAAYLNIDPQTLRTMRSKGTAPEAVSDGYRVWFRREDIERMPVRTTNRSQPRRPYTKIAFGS
jgi:Helix-turn-helix domain